MSFMEQFSSKGKDLTQKAKDLTEQTKIKNQIQQENEKITLLYQSIGKLYFENDANTQLEPYADIIKTIQMALMKIDEYQQELNGIKSKYVCPNCGASVTSTTQFCKRCGTRITNFTKET